MAFKIPCPAAGSIIPAASPHKITPSLHTGLKTRQRLLDIFIFAAREYDFNSTGGENCCLPFNSNLVQVQRSGSSGASQVHPAICGMNLVILFSKRNESDEIFLLTPVHATNGWE